MKGGNERNERLRGGKMGEMKDSEKGNGRNERLREGEMGKRKAFVKEKWEK